MVEFALIGLLAPLRVEDNNQGQSDHHVAAQILQDPRAVTVCTFVAENLITVWLGSS